MSSGKARHHGRRHSDALAVEGVHRKSPEMNSTWNKNRLKKNMDGDEVSEQFPHEPHSFAFYFFGWNLQLAFLWTPRYIPKKSMFLWWFPYQIDLVELTLGNQGPSRVAGSLLIVQTSRWTRVYSEGLWWSVQPTLCPRHIPTNFSITASPLDTFSMFLSLDMSCPFIFLNLTPAHLTIHFNLIIRFRFFNSFHLCVHRGTSARTPCLFLGFYPPTFPYEQGIHYK